MGFGSAALIPQVFGDVVDILRVFGRSVVFDVIHANGPTFDLTANTRQIRLSQRDERPALEPH